jgi:hypothetical protein
VRSLIVGIILLAACSAPSALPNSSTQSTGSVINGADAPRTPCAYSLAFDGDRYFDSTQCLAREDDVVSLRITEQPWSVYVWFNGDRATANVFVPGWAEAAEVVSMKRVRGERWEIAMRLETPDGHLVLGEVWATP